MLLDVTLVLLVSEMVFGRASEAVPCAVDGLGDDIVRSPVDIPPFKVGGLACGMVVTPVEAPVLVLDFLERVEVDIGDPGRLTTTILVAPDETKRQLAKYRSDALWVSVYLGRVN